MMPDSPPARRDDIVDDYHGHCVADPYRWLEDPTGVPQPRAAQWRDMRARWDEAQADLFAMHRARWPMRQRFEELLRELLSGGFTGLPVWRAGRLFYSRRDPGAQFAVLRTVDPDGADRALIDPQAIDPSGLTTLDGYQPNWEGDLLAYQLSEGGTEESVLRVMDVRTGEVVDGPIDRTRFSPVAWLPGGSGFYYVRRQPPGAVPPGEEQFHRRVRWHRMGGDAESDPEIFGAGMLATNYYGAGVTRDGRWLIVTAAEGTAPRNDVYLADLTAADPARPELRSVVVGRDAHTSLTIRPDGRMFVWTDHEAPRGRVMLADPRRPEPQHWTPLLAEEPDSVLESFRLVDGPGGADEYLIVSRTSHAVGSLAVHDSRSGQHLRDVALPGPGTVTGPVGRPEGGSEVWFGYTDHASPFRSYRYDAITGETSLWSQPPGAVAIPPVSLRQVAYRSADGTKVRMFILSPAEPAGAPAPSLARPAILYGYGGFGISLVPEFNTTALAWVAAGGVYAIANLRGGAEEGEDWHRAGMLANKQNVFDDFHSAAEHLVAEGWTTPAQLCISGGSNGGLLVGAAITQRPDLYGAALCSAPLLDMIRYVTSQLGATWTTEYGDPAVAEQFEWLNAYSPYHRLRDGVDYPAVLVSVYDNDTRTDPMHGRKFVAALQHATSGNRPILLRTEPDVGHGARSLDRSVALTADALSFAAWATGLR